MKNRERFGKASTGGNSKPISYNQIRGFGTNKDKIIWDSGNSIQWIAAKDILINKFKSKNVYDRIEIVVDDEDDDVQAADEVEFTRELPTRDEYVEEKVGELRAENDAIKEMLDEETQQLFNDDVIDENQNRLRDSDARIKHSQNESRINTTEVYRFQIDYEKAVSDYEKAKEKFNSDTAKVIEIFNESLGKSARSLITTELNENRFKAAWMRLDEYYNTNEEVDTSGLLRYLTNLIFNPNKSGSFEQFMGHIDHIFSQLNTAGNPQSDVNKLGIVRNALQKGTRKYNKTLDMCEFNQLDYQTTLDKLHSQEIKNKMEDYGDKSTDNNQNKRKYAEKSNNVHEKSKESSNNSTNDSKRNQKCFKCNKLGHVAKDCKVNNKNNPNACKICGYLNHKTSDCFKGNEKANNASNNDNNKSKNNKNNKKVKYDKGNAKKSGLKMSFKNKIANSNNVESDSDEESNMMYEDEMMVENDNLITEINADT